MFRQLFPLTFVFIVSITTLLFLQNKISTYNEEKREEKLKKIHKDAVNEFSRSVENFAALVSGMRSYIYQSDNFPTQNQLQTFLQDQLKPLDFKDSIVVSYINSDHKFIYSFTKSNIDPSGLVGRSVSQLRDTAAINRLDKLLNIDGIRLFPPINLIEGWMGIPLNFRVVRNDIVMGYVSSLINLRSITAPIDRLANSKDFVLKFEVTNGSEFDRDQVFNGFKVYHNRIDSLSSRYVDVPQQNWISTDINLFSYDFTISTAYRSSETENEYLNITFLLFYFVIIVFSVLSGRKSWQTHLLNKQLSLFNITMNEKNEELKALNQTKDRFFSIIGHDLRGPLSTIISLMEIVNSKVISTKEAEQLLKKLTPAAKSTSNLLDDLLKWAQINNDEISFSPEKTKTKEIIENSLDLVTTNAEMKGLKLKSDLEESPEVVVDKNMISTIIRNLVGNAIKFSKTGSEISIHSNVKDFNWIISIKDQGVGMSDEKIKEINKQKHSSSEGTDGERGSGLGLTICLAFIKEHNGNLEVVSQKGIGSEFKVSIPIVN